MKVALIAQLYALQYSRRVTQALVAIHNQTHTTFLCCATHEADALGSPHPPDSIPLVNHLPPFSLPLLHTYRCPCPLPPPLSISIHSSSSRPLPCLYRIPPPSLVFASRIFAFNLSLSFTPILPSWLVSNLSLLHVPSTPLLPTQFLPLMSPLAPSSIVSPSPTSPT